MSFPAVPFHAAFPFGASFSCSLCIAYCVDAPQSSSRSPFTWLAMSRIPHGIRHAPHLLHGLPNVGCVEPVRNKKQVMFELDMAHGHHDYPCRIVVQCSCRTIPGPLLAGQSLHDFLSKLPFRSNSRPPASASLNLSAQVVDDTRKLNPTLFSWHVCGCGAGDSNQRSLVRRWGRGKRTSASHVSDDTRLSPNANECRRLCAWSMPPVRMQAMPHTCEQCQDMLVAKFKALCGDGCVPQSTYIHNARPPLPHNHTNAEY